MHKCNPMKLVKATLAYLFEQSNIEQKYDEAFNFTKRSISKSPKNILETCPTKSTNNNNINSNNIEQDESKNLSEISKTSNSKKRKTENENLEIKKPELEEAIPRKRKRNGIKYIDENVEEVSVEKDDNNPEVATSGKSKKKTSDLSDEEDVVPAKKLKQKKRKSIKSRKNSCENEPIKSLDNSCEKETIQLPNNSCEEEQVEENNQLPREYQLASPYKRKADLTKDEMEFFRNIRIIPLRPPAPLHKITDSLSIPLPPLERQKIMKLQLKVKTGPYNETEIAILRNNWETFCETHSLDAANPSLFLNLKRKTHAMPKKKQVKFVQCLAHGLKDRTLFSVYSRFEKLYDINRKIGKFDTSEDDLILQFMRTTESKTPFFHLSKLLGRDKMGVRKRYRRLTNRLMLNEVDRTKWTDSKTEEFVQPIVEVTNTEDINNDNVIDEHGDQISKLQGNLSKRSLKKSWKFKIQPRGAKETCVDGIDFRIKLIKCLHKRGGNDWKTINWDLISKKFPGMQSDVLKDKFFRIIRYRVPDYKNRRLDESLDYLMNTVIPIYLKRQNREKNNV